VTSQNATPGRPFPVAVSSAGKMTVLGLEGVRARLTDRWDKISERVHAYFAMLLEREMKQGDCYYQLDELSYLIVFRDLSKDGAQIKTLAIAQAASRHLFGEDTGAVAIRLIVGAVDGQALLHDDPIAAVQAGLHRNGTETIVAPDGSVAPPEAGFVRGEIVADEPATQRLHVVFGPDCDHPELIRENRIAFRYRPIWDAKRKVILTYLCQPIPESAAKAERESLSDYGLCSVQDQGQALLLDLLVFREVAERVALLHKNGLRILIACPVHFATIGHTRTWTDYVRALDRAGRETLRDIAFMITEVDNGIPHIRLAQEIPKLSTRSKFVLVAIAYQAGFVGRFANIGIHGVGMELSRTTTTERPTLAAIDALALEAGNAGAASFVLGAKSRSIVIGAIGSGVRYLEGSVVAEPVAEPQHGFVQNIADLYS
jgi:hypothetical protein